MAKLQGCQFIQISVDGKVISGSSQEESHSKWFEGYSPAGPTIIFQTDGGIFDTCHISVLTSKEIGTLYEHCLKRGHKKIDITVVHRGTDKLDKNYETQRVIYHDCIINFLNFEHKEDLFMNLAFTVQGDVEVTFNVPDDDGKKLTKIGPIKYDIQKKQIA
jgi:hypothetical protein